MDPGVQCKTQDTKLPERNREIFYDQVQVRVVLGKTEAQKQRVETDEQNYIRLKSFCKGDSH